MKRVIIVSDGTYANDGSATILGGDDVETLATGAIAVLNEDNTLVNNLAPSFNGDRFYFAIGLDEDNDIVDISPLIDRDSMSFTEIAPAAAVAKVMWIGEDSGADGALNLPSPLVVGTVASIAIVDLEKRHEEIDRGSKVYSHVVTASDTNQTVLTGLMNLINAESNGIVTAALENTDKGIKLTGNTAGHNFTAYVTLDDNILSNADVLEYMMVNKVYDDTYTTATACSKGTGLASQMIDDELDSKVRQGYQNSFLYNQELWSFPSNFDATATYKQYVITWKTSKRDRLQSKDEPYLKEILLLVDSSKTTLVTQISDILNAV